ncbi:hypothetical protein D9M68_772660 [compost metagenome]
MADVYRPCIVCGAPMLTKRANRCICSASCHGKWHRARVKLFPDLSHSEVFDHLEEMQEFLKAKERKPEASPL